MKLLSHRFTVALLLMFFMLGFVNVADAAYAGKKKKAATEKAVTADVQAAAPVPQTPAAASESTILLVILSFILPPLAVYLVYEDFGTPFIVSVILTLLFWIPGVIHALYHVLK